MIRIRLLLGLCALACLGTTRATEPAGATEPAWGTDYAAACQQAAAEKRAILLFFTGSDWCVWCHRLEKEILSQPAFLDYARKNLQLVVLDFPRKTTLPEALARQNEELREKHAVEGYPTLVVLDPQARPLGTLGYMEGGPKTFVRALQRLIGPSPANP